MKKVLILGVPGSGKTDRLLKKVDSALASGIRPNRIGFASFTRGAVEEARSRACEAFGLTPDELPHFRTVHSFAFRELGLRRDDVLSDAHLDAVSELTGELLSSLENPFSDAPAAGRQADPLFTLDHYARTTGRSLEDAWRDHGSDLEWHRLLRFSRAYAAYKDDAGVLDFTDMLTRYADSALPPLDLDVGIIDEAQDLSRAQWRAILKLFGHAKELYIAGDDMQCQPGNTLITLEGGIQKRLDEIDQKRDALICYARNDASFYGMRGGYKFKKASRKYTGELYTVKTSAASTECTKEHKWLIKWQKEPDLRKKKHVTYLMKKGKWWRVGWCKLFNTNGTLHLNHRTNRERADAAWILKVHDSALEAYAYEQIVNAKYGIPMMPFWPVNNRAYARNGMIDVVFNAVNSEKGGQSALSDHSLLVAHPFINRLKPNYSRYGAAINEVVACNLLDGLMEVPIYDGSKNPVWGPFHVSKKMVKNLVVYGLDVEKYHTYVANGIATHNCIHHWAGADEEKFLGLAAEGFEVEHLSVAHRLPRAAFPLADEVGRRIGRRYERPWEPSSRQGSLDWVAGAADVDLTGAGLGGKKRWLVLARTRAQLAPLAAAARDQGALYTLKGQKSVRWADVRAIKAHEALRAGKGIASEEAAALGVAAGREFEAYDGERGAVALGYDASRIWHDALVSITMDRREYYLAVLRRGAKLTDDANVRIETIHGAKGAEAEGVVLCTDMTYRTSRGMEIDPDSEMRVLYVGLTRVIDRMFCIAPQTQYGYRI